MRFLKNKKIIFGIIVLLMFLVCVVGNFSTEAGHYVCRTYFSGTNVEAIKLSNGDVFEQELSMGDSEEGIQLMVGTYLTVLEGGKVVGELYEPDGNMVAKTETELYGLLDNEVIKLEFGAFDETVYNKTCKLRLSFVGIDGQMIAMYGTPLGVGDYECYYNGELQNYNLVMYGIKPTTYVVYRDIRLFFIFVIATIMAYIAMFKVVWRKETFDNLFKKGKTFIEKNWKAMALSLGLLLGCSAISCVIEWIRFKDAAYYNPYRVYAVFVFLFLISILAAFRKYIWTHAHIFFFITAMLVGSVNAVTLPAAAISWDEQIHYVKTAYLSWGGIGRISLPDYSIVSKYGTGQFYNVFEKAQQVEMHSILNTLDAQGSMVGYLEVFLPNCISYIPASLVFYATRLLGFSFTSRFVIGKLTNLFIYSICIAGAIKVLKGRGKILAAAIGLIPTNLFLASTYGYDSWITCFVILGYALFIGELQEKGYVSNKKMCLSVLAMICGILAKGVYFPLMFPMMLLKKDSYEKPKLARCLVVLGAIAIIISFILPMFAVSAGGGVAGGGDIRGGSEVNAGGQISYILKNLFAYLGTLCSFLWSYLNPDAAQGYITQTAYQGSSAYFVICMILIGIATVVDNDEHTAFQKKNTLAYVGGFIGAIGALILVVTALYISYTPVGANYVAGVQPRYIIPVLFPFLFFLGEYGGTVSKELKKRALTWCLVGMAFVALWMFYNVYIIQY